MPAYMLGISLLKKGIKLEKLAIENGLTSANLFEVIGIIQLQEDRDGGRIIGQDIVSMIKEKYNESYSVSGVYKLLKRMDMSWVSGRSIHTKPDLEVRETFKKTF